MENKNIVMLRHHPMNVKNTHPFYTNQVYDNLEDYIIIDVTSRVENNKKFMEEHPNFGKEISPFFIGPVMSSDGVEAKIFEIFWQCGKVYPCHDDNGKPNAAYFEWRNELYAKDKCTKELMRHACHSLGYEHKDTKYFAYFDKDKNEYVPLDYVQARKKVYIKEYAKLVSNTESFKWMKSLVDSGKKIALVDFDAYNYYSSKAKEGMYNYYLTKCKKNGVPPRHDLYEFLNIKTIKDVLNCPFMLCGHGFAIKMLLEGDVSVNEDGTINDPQGLLE